MLEVFFSRRRFLTGGEKKSDWERFDADDKEGEERGSREGDIVESRDADEDEGEHVSA